MNREEQVGRATGETQPWDLLVIGGGATGLGIALDGAARELRVLLVEQGDIAEGTSSRSTKLIHGGVRYLRQGNLALVRSALRERGRLLENAPGLVRPISFVIPCRSGWERLFYGAGLKLYDLLATGANNEGSRFLSRAQAQRLLPEVRTEAVRGGVLYHDARFDDARLAIALARTAVRLGAVVVNYVRVTGLLKEAGRIVGGCLRDEESGREFEVRARVVINATGVFADAVRRLDEPDAAPLLSVSQGSHLVLPARFHPGDHAVLVPKTTDGRVLFAIPWLGRVLLGTTDVPVAGPSRDPLPLDSEIEFLLDHAARYLRHAPAPSDVLSCFAGQRPLVGSGPNTAALPREHLIAASRSGLLTVTGGKWTTYRRMAELAVDRALPIAGLTHRPSPTARMLLDTAAAAETERLQRDDPGAARLLHPALPCTEADALRGIRAEMARSVQDVLARRTRALYLDARAAGEAAPKVAALLAKELGRDSAWADNQTALFQNLARRHLIK